MMFQLSASAASMKRLMRNWIRKGESATGATARASTTSAPAATGVHLAEPTSAPPAHDARGAHDQDEHEKAEADGARIGGAEVGRSEGLHEAQDDPAHHGAHHGAEPTQDGHHEGLEGEPAAHDGGDGKKHAPEPTRGAGQGRPQPEGHRVDMRHGN